MSTIFLTGATGHVGFRVLVLALEAGYSVRAAVRSPAKGAAVLSAAPIQALNPGARLAFVAVPDFTAPGAFDEGMAGADFVVHVAAPIASTVGIGSDLEKHYIGPSVQGTLRLLTAAQAHPRVQRVVITSSIAAIVDISAPDEAARTVVNDASRVPLARIPRPPYTDIVQAYCASKALALNAAEAWIREQQPPPRFGVTHILPGDIFGPNALVTDPHDMLRAGTNRVLLVPASGGHYKPTSSTTVHLDDVAAAHIAALRPGTPTNRVYLLHSGGVDGRQVEDLFAIVRSSFPDEAGTPLLPNNGSISTFSLPVDAAESEATLGFKYASFDKQVVDVVGYYLKHLRRAKGLPAKGLSA